MNSYSRIISMVTFSIELTVSHRSISVLPKNVVRKVSFDSLF